MQGSVAAVFALAALGGSALLADQIYRSVDAEGRVTYSTAAVPNAIEVQEVDIPPGPTEEQVREALKRASRTQKTVDEMTELRRQKEKEYRERKESARQQAKEQEQQSAEREGDGYSGYPRYPIYTRPILPHPPMRPPAAKPHPKPSGGSLKRPRAPPRTFASPPPARTTGS